MSTIVDNDNHQCIGVATKLPHGDATARCVESGSLDREGALVDDGVVRIWAGRVSLYCRSSVSLRCDLSVKVRGVASPFEDAGAVGCPRDVGCPAAREERAQALAEVARQQHGSLLRFLTQRTGSVEEAKEIAQEAYVKVLAVERQDSIASLASYLWRSALNLMTDRGRRRVVRERFARAVRAEAEQMAPSAETVVDARQRLDVIERAIGTLPPRCRTAFILRVLEGRPFDEVGRAMGISARMAKIYVARALAHLHACLDDTDPGGACP